MGTEVGVCAETRRMCVKTVCPPSVRWISACENTRWPSFRPHITLSNPSVSSIARRRVDDVLQTIDATLKKALEVLDDQVLHSPGPQR